jgi:hypothetical protein
MAFVQVDFIQALLPEYCTEIMATHSVLFLICTVAWSQSAPSSAKKGSYKKVVTISINCYR